MGYAFTDVSALGDNRAVTDPRASTDVRAVPDVCACTDVRRPASAPHAGRPVRRDP